MRIAFIATTFESLFLNKDKISISFLIIIVLDKTNVNSNTQTSAFLNNVKNKYCKDGPHLNSQANQARLY